MPMLVELYTGRNPLREIGGLERLEHLVGGELLKLERLWGMESLEMVTLRVSGKIKLEDIRSEDGIVMAIQGREGIRSVEEYVPETVNVYVNRLDIRVISMGGGEVDVD